jgi:hypothetical protein
MRMKKNNSHVPRRRRVMDHAAQAMEQMELYCAAHPGSPSAARRPQLLFRSELWIALLGPSMEEGIVGIAPTVMAALRAFDAQYLASLRPQSEAVGKAGALHRPQNALGATRRPSQNAKSDPKYRAEASAFAWPS